MKCAACNGAARVTSLALVAQPDGGVKNGRICRGCLKRALVIVPRITVNEVAPDRRKEQKRDAKEVLGEAVKKLRMQAKAYSSGTEDANGLSDGLNQAADILEAGDY